MADDTPSSQDPVLATPDTSSDGTAGYSVHHETPEYFNIQHPDGSSFNVAKDGLDDSQVSSINAMPKAADTPDTGPAPASVPFAPTNKADPSLPATPFDQVFQRQQKGVKNEANALATEGNAEKKAYSDYDSNVSDKTKNLDSRYNDALTRRAQLEQDIASAKINPNNFWADKSTGNKIGAALSLMFSGIGSGLTGQANGAQAVIKEAIDRDVHAQMQNLDTKKSLLADNFRETGDLQEAKARTIDQMLSATKVKIQGIAAGTQGQVAQARAQQALAAIDLEHYKLAQQQALYGQQAQANSGGISTNQESPALRMDKGYSATRVEIDGKAYQAASPKEGEDLRDMQARVQPLKNIINQLDALGPKAAIPGTQENLKAEALRPQLVAGINGMNGIKRLSTESINQAVASAKNPARFREMLNGGIKTSTLLSGINDKVEAEFSSKLKGYTPNLQSQGVVKKGFTK